MPAVPSAITSAMLRYQSQGVRPLLVRPPPVLAARATFLVDDALPIAAKDLTGPGPVSVVGCGPGSSAAPASPVREAGQTGPHHEPDRHRRKQQPLATGRRLVGELQRRAVMGDDHPVRMPAGRRALHMGDRGPRLEGDTPPAPGRPPAQIGLLEVHEVPLVESTQILPAGLADEEART